MMPFAVICAIFFYQGIFAEAKCDLKQLDDCQQKLNHYEFLFPFYGGTDADLQDACGKMGSTFICIETIAKECEVDPNCEGDCQRARAGAQAFLRASGVPKFSDQICDTEQPYRKKYLEYYNCMLSAEEKYAECQNKSHQAKLFYVNQKFKKEQEREKKAFRCCFFSWFRHCYESATMDHCDANATFVISYASHLLLDSFDNDMCSSLQACKEPPLDENYEPPPIVTKKEAPKKNDKTQIVFASSGSETSEHNVYLFIMTSLALMLAR